MENIKIKKIPINDRPRERLINNGVENLNNEELLSILLSSGAKNVSVKNLSTSILSKAGGIKKLNKLTYHDLIQIRGIGKAKACIIISLIELCKRMNTKIETINTIKLISPQDVYEFYKNRIDRYQEQVYCIYLDAKKKIIKDKLIFIGTVNHSLIHPRDIYKEAYQLNASYIICVHNHPSGDVNPSADDIRVTKRLKEVGDLTGIKLIDHIIVSEKNHYSFLENGQI